MHIIRPVEEKERQQFNAAVKHPLQTWEWGEFRRTTGVEIERLGIFDAGKMVGGMQISFHPIPKIPFTVGYFPKGEMPSKDQIEVLDHLAKRKKALFIKLEPNIATPVDSISGLDTVRRFLIEHGAVPGRPLFTRYTFLLNLQPSEEQLLAACKPKTRYNISVAEKKGVEIVEDTTLEGLQAYLDLQHETTARQRFYAHSDEYFQKMFQLLNPSGMIKIFRAVWEGKTLVVWIMFHHKDVLYYPYGASSREHRDLMASNLMMWRMIQLGKKLGCRSFDMWGSLGPDPSSSDPWFGFHRFKQGYGATLSEFVGTYDLVANPPLYQIFSLADDLRWKLLRFRANLPFKI